MNDILVASQRKIEIQQVNKLLNEEFGMKKLGLAIKILRVKISRQRAEEIIVN